MVINKLHLRWASFEKMREENLLAGRKKRNAV
jgi:hypothetical protein